MTENTSANTKGVKGPISLRLIIAAIIACMLLFAGYKAVSYQFQTNSTQAIHFEHEIAAFEEQDRADPPSPGRIVFIGSSSIRRWDTLEQDMQPLNVLNRGFGGSMLRHSTQFADRIITPYQPSAVVIYAGDNDIGNQIDPISADQLMQDFDAFAAKVRSGAGDIPIVYIAIKPSISRAAQWPEMARANAMIAARAASDPQTYFADIASPMLDDQGKAIGQYLGPDGLHMTADGYALWTGIIRPILIDIESGPAGAPESAPAS